MIMQGGEAFTGNSGFSYEANAPTEIGPADVRMALMLGWTAVKYPTGGVYSAPDLPDMLTVHLMTIDKRLAQLESREPAHAP